ncbi:hypothetical protein, partial [Virgibacillus pantothenticus]|uniref:hypothetical protein n=1 Tax=Virgibacillus pantothenticus TaxID=1473 RepID=UPI0025B22DA1
PNNPFIIVRLICIKKISIAAMSKYFAFREAQPQLPRKQKWFSWGIFSSRCSRRTLPILTTLKLAYTQLAIFLFF